MHEPHNPTDRAPLSLPRAASAELVGSFFVVVAGAGSVVVAGTGGGGLVGVALATGFAFGAASAATLPLSGGGVNPALTAAFWVAGRLSSIRAAVYVIAQLVGGILAALLLRVTMPEAMWRPATLGAPLLARDEGPGPAVVLEATIVFLLTTTAFALLLGTRGRARAVVGLVLGVVVTAGTLVAWPLTGAALNPARALGPELASWTWTGWWIYWVGPGAGAVIGAVASWWVLLRAPSEPRRGPITRS
jgi:aquaporin TIP